MTNLGEITRLEVEIERLIEEASAAAYAAGRLNHPADRLLSCAAARPLEARLRDLRAAADPVQVEAPAPAPAVDHRATEIRRLAATNPAARPSDAAIAIGLGMSPAEFAAQLARRASPPRALQPSPPPPRIHPAEVERREVEALAQRIAAA